jgi:hypothetical protein
MALPERQIWQRFLQTGPGSRKDWQYEVELGLGSYGPTINPPAEPDFYLRLLKKRVDALALTPESVIIAEVKQVAGMAALGQLLTYRALYHAEKTPTVPIALWAVCGRVDYDVTASFAAFGIQVYVV